MSNFNYMDDVPVKIAESYKPLPKVFQIPQVIANKLQLPPQHYHESPHYAYDFQLEKKVLAKMPDWRRMRQHEREQRRERKQKREEQRLRAVEQQHKQMLGAVSYPDAEELSSESDTDEEEKQVESNAYAQVTATNGPTQTLSEDISFDNILQPTILPQSHSTHHARNKSNSSFNYKDFEEDTSSPFDNIELKTINDLDILAQVLQHAQLNSSNKKDGDEQKASAVQPITNAGTNVTNTLENNLHNALNVQVDLERKDLNEASQQQQQTKNIPANSSNNFDYGTEHHAQLSKQNFCAYATNQQQQQQQLSSYMQHYNQQQPAQLQQQQQQQLFPCIVNTNFNQLQQQTYASNHNYLYSTTTCNGGGSYNSPAHNANTFPAAPFVASYGSPQIYSTLNAIETEAKIKAKSVPDILKELKEEVRSSEMRRSRNCSYNQQEKEYDTGTENVETEAIKTPQQMSLTTTSNQRQPSSCYNMLEATTQTLAKNISSMGFPLERVAKIAQIFGADDKKIIEHLIPLSELIDLGFDESKISEALMRFDNNKEKALEYLIA